MNKKTMKIAMAAVVAAVAGYVTYQNQTKEVLSELGMENVEALAAGESLGGYTSHTFKCPPPKEYKNQITCTRGGSEECYPSDC